MILKKNILLASLLLFIPGTSSALNFFEYFLIKTGVVIVYDQYFDKSLNYESQLSKKNEILTNFYNNKSKRFSFSSLKNLPIQQQMLVIEEINSQNNY